MQQMKRSDLMFCPFCGKETDPMQKFCENCGNPLKSDAVPSESYDQPEASSHEALQPPAPDMPDASDNNIPPQSDREFGSSAQSQMNDTAGWEGYSGQNVQSSFGQGQPLQNSFQQPEQPDGFGGQQPVQPGSFGEQQPVQYGGFSNGQDMPPQSKAYSGTMPITNGNRVYDGVSSASMQKKKGFMSPKKIIIIAVIALLVAVIGIFSFIFIRKKIQRDQIVNNPTMSAVMSYKSYLDVNNADDPIYAVLKDSDKSGTLTINATGKMKGDGTSSDIDAKATVGYDRKQGRSYLKVDGGKIFSSPALGGDGNSKAVVEMNMDPDKLYLNYDIMGGSGKYFIDNKNFRKDIKDSIFAFDKDNVLKFSDEESYESFVDMYETMVSELSDYDKEGSNSKTTTENIIKLIEKHGDVTVTDENAIVTDGQKNTEIPAYAITYTFGKDSLKSLIKDVKEEYISYLDKVSKGGSNSSDTKDSIAKSVDEMLKSIDSTVGNNFRLVVKFYLDRDNSSAIKTSVKAQNITVSGKGSFDMNIDFLKAPENQIRMSLTSENEKGEKSTVIARIVKTDNNDTLKYEFSGETKSDAASEPNKTYASFEYDRKKKKFSFTAGSGENGVRVSYTGDAEITSKRISLKFDDIVKTDEMQLSMKVDFTPDAPAAVNTDGAKNVLKISKSDFENMFGENNMLMSLFGAGLMQPKNDFDDYDYHSFDGPGYDNNYSFDDDYDYDYDYDYDFDFYDDFSDLPDLDISVPDTASGTPVKAILN